MKRVAVVGSGPAGFYTILRLLKNGPVAVDLFEKLPVPFGLTRFGVAPDHPEVKSCQERFAEAADEPSFRYFGNVDVGKDIALKTLLEKYHAVLLAYGAETSKHLEVPGSSAPGVLSARDFVGWYNGEPSCRDFAPPVAQANTVSVIGNGNVALDVARILLRPADQLRSTDIPEHVLSHLATSTVRRVRIVGRRGPLQAAFTTKELRELLTEPEVGLEPIPGLEETIEAAKPLGRADIRKMSLLLKGSTVHSDHASRHWNLDFLRSPAQFHSNGQLLSSIDWTVNKLENVDGHAAVVSTSETVNTPSELAVASIGYLSKPLPGMQELGMTFKRGILDTRRGQVTGVPSAFASGWLKTGPVGVIAATMMDAFAVGDEMSQFLATTEGERPGISAEELPCQVVSWKDWQEIDRQEIAAGNALNKPREKYTTTAEMLKALD